MNRILLASVAVLGLVGTAAAQQAPSLYGSNYSANVLNEYNDSALPGTNGIGLSSNAAIRDATRGTTARPADGVKGTARQGPSNWEIHSGR